MEENKSLSLKINKPLLKTIVFLIGCIATFAAGLFFVIAGDLMLTTQSIWLMLTILLAFGSAICAFISNNFKDKRTVMHALKGVAIGVAVLLIAYLVIYLAISIAPYDRGDGFEMPKDEVSFAIKKVRYDKELRDATMSVLLTTIVLGAVGLVGQVADLLLTLKLPED